MTLTLNTLPKSKSEKGKAKRVGRGNSSGVGNYCRRGMKGQKSRSGGNAGLKRKGLRSKILSLPKYHGIKPVSPVYKAINLTALNNAFEDNSLVTAKTLVTKGLIKKVKVAFKILGKGELNKKLTIDTNIKVSHKALEKIVAAGGGVDSSNK